MNHDSNKNFLSENYMSVEIDVSAYEDEFADGFMHPELDRLSWQPTTYGEDNDRETKSL
jgi:hypothetical protein